MAKTASVRSLDTVSNLGKSSGESVQYFLYFRCSGNPTKTLSPANPQHELVPHGYPDKMIFRKTLKQFVVKHPKLPGKQLSKRQFGKYRLFYSSLQEEANLKSKSQSSYDYNFPSYIQSNLFIQTKVGLLHHNLR